MTLTQAQLNAMNRVTPTGLAEEVYAARQPRKLPSTRGPAGIEIPHPNAVFRPTIEPNLLGHIIRAAFAAYSAEQLPAEWVRSVADALAAELVRRYPPEDMAVLARYGHARAVPAIVVEMGILGFHKLQPAQPVTAPCGVAHFKTSERGSGEMVPAELLPFFDRIADVRGAKTHEFDNAGMWPSQFKARERRWPTWREIEEAWPRIGAWVAAQREAARAAARTTNKGSER